MLSTFQNLFSRFSNTKAGEADLCDIALLWKGGGGIVSC